VKPESEEYLIHLDHSIKEIGRGGFQQEVNDGFAQAGYEFVYHTHDSRNSPKGFPDTIVAVEPSKHYLSGRPPLIVIELKAANNKPTPEQLAWLNAFRLCGAMTFVLWPRHRLVLNDLYAGNFNSPRVTNRLHLYEKGVGNARTPEL
jgi:hypothetical protein